VSTAEKSLWETVREVAGPFPPEAFLFVQEGLRWTVDRMDERAGNTLTGDLDRPDRHISGQDLCIGLRDFAIEHYGLLARTVLAHWNIHRTEDFGKIVFAMVAAGLMRKAEHDSEADFVGVFDFDEVFGRTLEKC
jgi:uncharacterized repeat protein (TIGR04138 family)